MADLDGQLILETLYSLEQPATLKIIVSTVAETYGTETNQVRNAVKKILKAGVEHGYVQYAQGKYSADVMDIKAPIKKTGNGQPEDATRRRRRSTSRRRQRSGSRRSRSRPRRHSSTRR